MFTVFNALRAFLYNVQPRDGVTLASAGIVLTTISLLAAYVPALRASRVDPIVALRED